jgi:RimJ/RimL family protein N-acetyltransferase
MDEQVHRFVASQTGSNGWAGAKGIGVEQDGELIAGVVFERYDPGVSVNIHVGAVPGKHWCTREFLRKIFVYAFMQLGCQRVNGFVDAHNTKALRFDEHVGFKREGVMKCANKAGGDVIVMGMLRSECRWIKDYAEIL